MKLVRGKKEFDETEINNIISDTVEQTVNLEQILDEAPYILEGYRTFRDLLRMLKRGIPLEEAAKKCCFDACPPSRREQDEECNIGCPTCWIQYFQEYRQKIKEKQI